jgi:hypothetical protein
MLQTVAFLRNLLRLFLHEERCTKVSFMTSTICISFWALYFTSLRTVFVCISRRTNHTKYKLYPDKPASIGWQGYGSAANTGQAWPKTFVARQCKDKVDFLYVPLALILRNSAFFLQSIFTFLNQHSHFSPSLCNTSEAFVSSVIRTLHVSTKLTVIRCTGFRGNCRPVVTMLHFALQMCKLLINYF